MFFQHQVCNLFSPQTSLHSHRRPNVTHNSSRDWKCRLRGGVKIMSIKLNAAKKKNHTFSHSTWSVSHRARSPCEEQLLNHHTATSLLQVTHTARCAAITPSPILRVPDQNTRCFFGIGALVFEKVLTCETRGPILRNRGPIQRNTVSLNRTAHS